MVLLEEFKDKVRPDIRSHLDEQKVGKADDYALTHKMSSTSGNPQQKRYHGSGNRENISRNTDDRKRQGNIITNCWKLGGKHLVNIVVGLTMKVRIVELPRIISPLFRRCVVLSRR